MSTTSMKSAARSWIENGFNRKNLDEFDNYFSPDVVNHELPPTLPQGVEGTKMFVSGFLNAFPDIHVHIDDLVAEDNRIVTRWSAHATHTGELMGIPATGKKVNMSGIAIDRFEGGKSVEHWEIFDQMGLMQQLGVVPSG